MDDLISRAYVLAEYDLQHQGPPGCARKIIEEAPAVDAVPVIRCKDCKHLEVDWANIFTGKHLCPVMDCYPDPDFYCGYGERRDGDT